MNEKSAKAGIDPYQKLIEQYYFDNVQPLGEQEAGPKPVAAR